MNIIDCYTDGACPGNGTENATGGLGFAKRMPDGTYHSLAVPWNEYFKGRYGEPTNQKCELLAGMFPVLASMILSGGSDKIESGFPNQPDETLWDSTGQIKSNWRVHSDSKYLVDGINHWLYRWKSNGWKNSKNKPIANMQMWKDMDAMLSFGHNRGVFSFFYVPGHSGDKGNDAADFAAVLAAKNVDGREAHAQGVLRMPFNPEAWDEYMTLLKVAEDSL